MQAGDKVIVILDKGHLDGIKNGLELTLYRGNSGTEAPLAASAPPESGYGEIRIFRTLNHTSYGAVTRANVPLKLLDIARSQ
jgi:hypothetical protein